MLKRRHEHISEEGRELVQKHHSVRSATNFDVCVACRTSEKFAYEAWPAASALDHSFHIKGSFSMHETSRPGFTLRPAGPAVADLVYSITEASMRRYVEETWGHFSETETRASFTPESTQI